MSKTKRDTSQAVRELCTSFPEAEAFISHGMANYRVRGKTFAMFAVNHHGDGRIALWLNMPQGAQALYVEEEPKHYFVPPYVGPRGWLGVRLDTGAAWSRISKLVQEAYTKAAPPKLSQSLKPVRVPAPEIKLTIESVDPFATNRGATVLNTVRKICSELPETSEAKQFGWPVWKVGKKVFARLHGRDGRIGLAFWVGLEQQSLFTSDPLFSVPPYIGHNGWIELDVSKQKNWKYVRSLLMLSYRRYAARRLLRDLI